MLLDLCDAERVSQMTVAKGEGWAALSGRGALLSSERGGVGCLVWEGEAAWHQWSEKILRRPSFGAVLGQTTVADYDLGYQRLAQHRQPA